MAVPDYYAMLEVEPEADRATIEAALARCQPKWSSGTRNPKNKHTFQSYLDQIPALRQALLGDLSARAAYDAELAAARRAERDAKLDELQRLVRLRAAKGGLTVSDRAILKGEAERLGLTVDDLNRLAESIPPMPEAPAVEPDEPEPPRDVVDSATRRQIRLALEHLRKRDLYEVLGLTRDAPAPEIAARADAERKRWMHKSQVTAEKTAWLEAVSYAQSHLGTPESRARYDRTLSLEAEEALAASVAFAVRGTPALDPGTHQFLLDEAAGRGITPALAERLIRRTCRASGVALEGGAASTPSKGPGRWLRCRSCEGVTEFRDATRGGDEAVCRHCGVSLRWECPACRRMLWADEGRCPCGFPRENLEPLVRHFEAAQRAFKAREYGPAVEHLRRVLELAPAHSAGRKALEKVRERVAEVDRLRARVVLEVSRRHLVAALKAAEAWGSLVDPAEADRRAAFAEIVEGLREARTLAARARALADRDPVEARGLYRRSLAVAADLPEALEGLSRCPPDPPTDLHSEVSDRRVALRWTAPTPDGLGPVRYRVVRKRDALPAGPADGVLVAVVDESECKDADVKAGESYGYGVFSERNGVASRLGVGTGPLFVVAEVTDVRVEAQSRRVALSWRTPPGAAEVRVVRRRGSAPAGLDDGERVETLRDRAEDRGLEDDRAYHYGLFALYRRPDGRLQASRGVSVAAMPSPPVAPLAAPGLEPSPGGGVRLSWSPPARGIVKVLRTAGPVPHAVGERLSADQVRALVGEWIEGSGLGEAFDPRPPAVGSCLYTPLTAWADAHVVGEGSAYSCLPDPSDLRALRSGRAGRVHLRWRWSGQGPRCLVLARAGADPAGPDDPEALRATVDETEYGRLGYFAMNLPPSPEGPWHLKVYSMALVDGRPVVSPGLEPTARTAVPGPHPEVAVSYALRQPKLPGRPWTITFRTEPPGSEIPPTALIAHPRAVPLSADDGELVDRFPAARDGASFRFRPEVNLAACRARVFLDPRAAPDVWAPIRLRHPEAGTTRV